MKVAVLILRGTVDDLRRMVSGTRGQQAYLPDTGKLMVYDGSDWVDAESLLPDDLDKA
jgi:hypothetical protein